MSDILTTIAAVEWIVTEALAHGNKVVINANW